VIFFRPCGNGYYWLAEYNCQGRNKLKWSLVPHDHSKPTRRIKRVAVPSEVRRAAWYHLVDSRREA